MTRVGLGLFVVALVTLGLVGIGCKGTSGGDSGCGACGDACGGCGACGACGDGCGGCGACGACGDGCGGCSACGACGDGCGGCSGCGGCGGKSGCGAACGGGGCGGCGGCGCGGCSCGGCGGCGGCGCGGGAGTASSDDKHAKQLFASYKNWSKLTAASFKSKGHGNMMVHDWVNSRALATFRANKGNYAPGAAVAKTGWKGDALKKVWFMEKRGSGYDKENGDWWYAQLNAAGKVEKAGKVSGCINCHDGADNDYVFGLKR